MKKDYRISRNVRLAWFLGRLHQVVCSMSEAELATSDSELDILSILPNSWQPDEPLQTKPYLLVPSTHVTFLAHRYRFVIELDLSPSTGIVDDSPGEIIFDEVFYALSRCLGGLLKPFRIPGSDIIFQPEIFITIQAYSSIISLQMHQVYTQLCAFENKVAEMLQHQYEAKTQADLSSLNQEHVCDSQEMPGKKLGVSMVTADVGLVSMIRQGILALQLLPSNSTAGIIVITDGVTSVPDVAVCETLLNQLRSGTVACSFIQVGGVYSYDCSFGHVPNVELMKFIAMATFGTYLSTCPEVEPSSLDMNVYHKAFLPYSFLRSGESLNPEYYCGGTQLEVKLILLWKHNMRIEYLAVASWPLDPSKRSIWVEVTMEGSYDILHDISCTVRKPITSLYRTTVIRRFWNTLQSINQTDQMLVHLQSFDSVPEHFTIPDSTRNGVPLFYIPPGSTTPVLSLQHSSSDSSHSQFAAYWKPILSMDANLWQRWLHMHRIVILLEHDMPVPKHLHTPGNNGRYSTIQCRISHSALTSLLRDWSSFVLVEGYSYVRLMHRIISKAPCMVLRLGFPIGTLAKLRNKIVEELRDCILQLRFPHRVQSKEATPKVKRKVLGSSSPSKSSCLPMAQPPLSDRPCLIVLHKPLEKLLIRYYNPPMSGPLTMVANRTASSTLASLSRYFYHQRWIWCVQSGLVPAVPITAVAQLLSTLTEIRLSEGFHFASSGEGIVSMVQELPMKSDSTKVSGSEKHTCIVQYVIFPPHATSTKDSFSTDEDNDTEVEAIEVDMELNIVTECWIEPQSGYVDGVQESWQYLHGLSYQKIPKAIYPRDLSCIHTVLAFEYISQLCQNKDWVFPACDSRPIAVEGRDDAQSGSRVHEIPFQFDLMKLLPKCQQIEMDSSFLPNEMLLSLFHGCLQHDLSDREITLLDTDHVTFMEQVLQRDRDGHPPPFKLSTVQGKRGTAPVNIKESKNDFSPTSVTLFPQWRCYAKLVNPQHLFLTFLPAMFSDVQRLMTSGPDQTSKETDLTLPQEAQELKPMALLPAVSITPAVETGQTIGDPDAGSKKEGRISFSRQASQPDLGENCRIRCPVFVYSCSLEVLREQMINSRTEKSLRDIFFRNQSVERPTSAPWLDSKHKEVVSYCTLLQEHSHQCYVKGLFRSLQQGHNISSPDLLIAMDYCEELLQEIDITRFLMTLCSHVRTFCERHQQQLLVSLEGNQASKPRGILTSVSSAETEDFSEADSHGSACPSQEPHQSCDSEFPLSLLDSKQPCQAQPDLQGIIQEKFLEISSLYFKPVPSNPHYYFYCPPSTKKEEEVSRDHQDRKGSEDVESSENDLATDEGNTSSYAIGTESDPELEVEYRERLDQEFLEAGSLSDSNTVNQDDDSFSVLGDSLAEQELLEQDMPPLFMHLTCSVKLRSQHCSMPVCSLPTCLGDVLGGLESSQALHTIDLSDLCVTLDIFVLTVPLEIEMVNDLHHNRYTSESSVSFTRSPGQPSSFRSDDELIHTLDRMPSSSTDWHPALSNLPAVHRQAVEATMTEIRWLLDDEIVSALRYSQPVTASILSQAASHIYSSQGRPSCHCEVVPLQFVFGPENSLERFCEEFQKMPLPGYVLNPEGSDFYYASVSRLHTSVSGPSPSVTLESTMTGGRCDSSSKTEGSLPCSTPPHEAQSLWAWSANENKTGECLGISNQVPVEVSDQLTSVDQQTSILEQGCPGEETTLTQAQPQASFSDKWNSEQSLLATPSVPNLTESVIPSKEGCYRKQQLSQVQSLVSSQGSMDSDLLGYDGGSSDSEGEEAVMSDLESRCPLIPDFWLIIKIHQDRVEVYSHMRSYNAIKATENEEGECIQLHWTMVKKVGEICRVVNQRLLLQDLHDSHIYYPGEESYQPRDYLAATMQFIPGHFACDAVWSTTIHVHSRLKMGPNMGVARAIQALRSVLNAFSVVNRKNMFVYQERATKSVFYLRVDSARPISQIDRHIQLVVHGVAPAGPEITDELVKVLRRRLDEATLDIITVMLVRNCKLTPADVEFIQPPGSLPTEVLQFTLPTSCLPWLPAVACYLRQNLLIFLHTPKYTDSNVENHFKHCLNQNSSSSSPELDLYLYNKPGGQGTGGKGVACIALSFVDDYGNPISLARWVRPSTVLLSTSFLPEADFESLTTANKHESEPGKSQSALSPLVRFDIWEKGNISLLQLSERLRHALRHALCDALMEFHVLPNPLCVETSTELEDPDNTGVLRRTMSESKGLTQHARGRVCPPTLPFSVPTTSLGEPVTPTSKMGRRSFWDKLSKPEMADQGSPKTTDDIVLERPEENRSRRRHKTESVKQHSSQEQEGDVGILHPVFSQTCQSWMAFMNRLGCPSVQQCVLESVSRFLLPSIMLQVVNLITTLASDTTVKVFEKVSGPQGMSFVPYSLTPGTSARPAVIRQFTLLGRSFHQWRCSTEQAVKGFQRFESTELSSADKGCDVAPRQRFLFMEIIDKKLVLYIYNWSVDMGSALNNSLTRLLQWQNARAHVVHCLLSQKLGLFHHYCYMDTPWHEDSKQEQNPFLNSTLEIDALIRSPSVPPSKEQGRLSSSARILQPLHFPPDMVPFDEALRDVSVIQPIVHNPEQGVHDPVAQHGAQFLEIKNTERKELEKQMKIENLFVTWQQRSAQSNMPISLADLDTLKQSSRLVHYCATPLLFDPGFRQQIQADQQSKLEGKKRHRSNDSTASGRDRSHSCDSAEGQPCRSKDEAWLLELCHAFLQQYIQYLQSMGFILVQVRPASPARSSTSRIRALASMAGETRGSFSYSRPKTTNPPVTAYHLQRALPGGIVLMELAFQGCYFCVKQYALECSRIPMGQTVNSQLSMLFTEECDKVRDLMHVHSFSYDFHLRIVHQYLLGSHMALRQGTLALPTNTITAHQLYNYITDHASTYHMKPLRMARPGTSNESKKGTPSSEQNEYALVSIWNSSGSYKDSEGLRHHDDFDVSLLVCHSAVPFEDQSEVDRHMLRLQYYVIMTSQRELFPRLTADMRRFKKLPRLQREALEPVLGRSAWETAEGGRQRKEVSDPWEEVDDHGEFYAGGPQVKVGPGLFYTSPLFPLLASEVAAAQKQLSTMVQCAKGHCRRDNLWKRLFLLEPLASDKLKLGKLSLSELEELLDAVHKKSIADIDPQLSCFLTMTASWYQSLIKVLLSRFPQSCRHFQHADAGTQYLSLTVVFRELFPVQPQDSESPLPQLVSTYHHLESVVNTACFNLWTGLL
ncbi:Protein SZT2, partial [Ophiophagus hannah]